MRNSFKKITASLLLLFLISITGLAQSPEMADTFRAEGKIYVVVAIILVVLVGLIGYLVILDRKINRMEKLLNGKKPSG